MLTNRATKKSNFRSGTLVVPDEIALVMPRCLEVPSHAEY